MTNLLFLVFEFVCCVFGKLEPFQKGTLKSFGGSTRDKPRVKDVETMAQQPDVV